ncbi:hypothetical protein F511_43808 [Dorcoceras hygrometricum]|uniref:Uncharacterized protein n=1 Tax=Dorcoceras hygrometricum TaxID=472368 RepID=A0A2Z7BAD7_9LAMI|nr:hypothetical protein F511_43808 [Dorcoceras hygrometricum]
MKNVRRKVASGRTAVQPVARNQRPAMAHHHRPACTSELQQQTGLFREAQRPPCAIFAQQGARGQRTTTVQRRTKRRASLGHLRTTIARITSNSRRRPSASSRKQDAASALILCAMREGARMCARRGEGAVAHDGPSLAAAVDGFDFKTLFSILKNQDVRYNKAISY